jgi:hypothetical protein
MFHVSEFQGFRVPNSRVSGLQGFRVPNSRSQNPNPTPKQQLNDHRMPTHPSQKELENSIFNN